MKSDLLFKLQVNTPVEKNKDPNEVGIEKSAENSILRQLLSPDSKCRKCDVLQVINP